MSGDEHGHAGEARRFAALCNDGARQAREVLAGSALRDLARALGESVKRNRGKASS